MGCHCVPICADSRPCLKILAGASAACTAECTLQMSAMHGEGDSNRAIFSTLHGCLAIITNVHHSSQECIAGLQRPCLRERHAVERVSPASHVKICSNTFIHCPDLQSLPGSWSICLSGITAPDLYCGPKTLPAAAPHQLQAAPCDNLLAWLVRRRAACS